MSTQNYINHIVLVLDASASMNTVADQVVKVADAQIAYLAERSKELDQETRVTVYTFKNRGETQCIFYDKDVLRLPSLRGIYRADGQRTALIEGTLRALDDLAQTPELYGDHAFLVYVLTDGQENTGGSATKISERLRALPENWTVACMVPNQHSVFEAKSFGFPAGNIAVWDAASVHGVTEGGAVMRAATESFMTARSTGVRGSRGLFHLDTTGITSTALQHNLEALHPGQYRMLAVDFEEPIADFYERKLHIPYVKGVAYYQVNKSEIVQGYKPVAIFEKATHKLYAGKDARRIVGLPDYEVRVSPSFNPKYDIFVQSTSVNRKLVPGTSLLIIS